MTQGFLLFAYNNEEIDYALLAAWCAKRINKYLHKPVSLVTNTTSAQGLGAHKKYFDKIIYSDTPLFQRRRYLNRFLAFNNHNRSDAWDLTPYDETMVIDTDIVIQSNTMDRVWNSEHSMMICGRSIDAYTNEIETEFQYLSETSIKFYWATQFYFKKNKESEIFFKTCRWVRENYVWLSRVYDVDSNLLRNDYIWSIAAHMLHQQEHLPWTLLHSTYATNLHSIQDGQVIVYKPKYGAVKIKNHDIHIMHKDDLIPLARNELEQSND